MPFKATPGIDHRTPRKRAEEFSPASSFDGPSEQNHFASGGHPIGPGMPRADEYVGIPPQINPAASPSKDVKRPFKGG